MLLRRCRHPMALQALLGDNERGQTLLPPARGYGVPTRTHGAGLRPPTARERVAVQRYLYIMEGNSHSLSLRLRTCPLLKIGKIKYYSTQPQIGPSLSCNNCNGVFRFRAVQR